MNLAHGLIAVGVIGVLLDLVLHMLQMFPRLAPASVRTAAWITLLSCILGGASLIPQWNLPLLIMEAVVGTLAVVSLATGEKEATHERT